jgi:hypothetical protein
VVTVQLEATTSTGAGAMTARRIRALHPSHQALGSLARPFVKTLLLARFRTPTTLTKYNSETKPELWLANFRLACSWVGLPMIGSSFDNFACSYRTSLEPSSRTSYLDRSTTGATW